MATTVIIPARNEEATIGAIVREFQSHPETHRQVFVGIDEATVDRTAEAVWANGGCAIHTGKRGKGQVVAETLRFIRRDFPLSDRVILCDADYTGLNGTHITKITSKYTSGMVVGVPDWPNINIPAHVVRAWPMVSGFRCLPWDIIPENAHGYMLETQLNMAAISRGFSLIYVAMDGLKSPFQWPLAPGRQADLERDRIWGKENGIL